MKEKIKLTFSRLFDNPLSKYIILKIAVLGYIAKLKRGLRLAFGAHFQHDFSVKMFCI